MLSHSCCHTPQLAPVALPCSPSSSLQWLLLCPLLFLAVLAPPSPLLAPSLLVPALDIPYSLMAPT